MSRSVWKISSLHMSVVKKLKVDEEKKKSGNKVENKSFYVERGAQIPIEFLGKKVKISSGKSLVELLIVEDMLGRKFGEFIFTKRRGNRIHIKEVKKKKKKRSG